MIVEVWFAVAVALADGTPQTWCVPVMVDIDDDARPERDNDEFVVASIDPDGCQPGDDE